MHFGLVGSLAFFFATQPACERAGAEGRVPFAMPEAKAFVAFLEALILRGLAPDTPDLSGRKGARA